MMNENTAEQQTELDFFDQSTSIPSFDAEVPGMPMQVGDPFEVDTGGIIDPEYIVGVDLPMLRFHEKFHDKEARVNEQSNIIMHLEPVGDCCKQVLSAAKHGISSLKIKFVFSDIENNEEWEFNTPTIKAINFDSIKSIPRQDVRKISVEISYESFSINGEAL